ncbi:tyrosyl-tRNA synthetase [Caldisphaera lagunensis DSM 15908]|uniref:Tyrosine--tRNA ligase n=1 Tax=Caldisphaera lagunensis (strain DSM 15908 / JCM 11604 / ANMR 0165 / IC-154) TaxID=1056495 RepID=L0A9C1_CALLD|nr:tyrosyl-tRNA synthetase [Caldisphaera lagunensis DSM 15908]
MQKFLDAYEKFELIKKNLAEVLTENELKEKIENGIKMKGYLGFEPSGLPHLGWIVWMNKVKDLIDAGVEFNLLEATWHAMINDKLGGNMELIRKAARLTRDVMKALNVQVDKINFVDAEKMARDKDYWALVIKVMKMTSLARMKRALTIMGRNMDEADLDTSKLIYPAMQVSDIIYMDLDIALGGLDQRKAHVLAREIAEKINAKKPIGLHTPILTGLDGGKRMETGEIDEQAASYKMSKSKPNTAIFVNDSEEDIKNKIMNAYCPPRQTEFNPILDINKYLLFPQNGFKLVIERPEKYGGTIIFEKYNELENEYANGKVHPLDLKTATANSLIEMLKPVRKLFEKDDIKELAQEILKGITR